MFDRLRRGQNYNGADTTNGTGDRTTVMDRPQEGAVQDRPVQDRAVQDRPVQDQAVQDRPVQDRAVQDRAVQDRPVQDRAVQDRAVQDRPARTHAIPAGAGGAAAAAGGPATAAEARAVQRERFGGADGTAIFFGWLSALGLAALLLAVVGAAGTRLGFAANVSTSDATSNAGTIGIVGAAILVVVLLLAYYSGGYVAGRMARFDGGRQGFRVWLLGLLVTIAAAVAGWIGGSQYNVYQQLNLPRIPIKEGDIATGAIITLVVVLVGTLLAAIAGGKAGDRYHARVDAVAWDAPATTTTRTAA